MILINYCPFLRTTSSVLLAKKHTPRDPFFKPARPRYKTNGHGAAQAPMLACVSLDTNYIQISEIIKINQIKIKLPAGSPAKACNRHARLICRLYHPRRPSDRPTVRGDTVLHAPWKEWKINFIPCGSVLPVRRHHYDTFARSSLQVGGLLFRGKSIPLTSEHYARLGVVGCRAKSQQQQQHPAMQNGQQICTLL